MNRVGFRIIFIPHARECFEGKGRGKWSTTILFQERKRPVVPKHTKTTKNLAATQSSTSTIIRKELWRKLKVRETAKNKNSFRSTTTMAFAITSAVTLFQVGSVQSSPMQPGRPPVSSATEGAQLFERLVSKAN